MGILGRPPSGVFNSGSRFDSGRRHGHSFEDADAQGLATCVRTDVEERHIGSNYRPSSRPGLW
jgi:hypothetical protein